MPFLQSKRVRPVVVRLKGGDPLSSVGEARKRSTLPHSVFFEIVPGVTSAISVPRYAGIPLTHRDHASTVVFITGPRGREQIGIIHQLARTGNGSGYACLLMGMKNLGVIAKRLIFEGKDPATPACVIQSGTLPAQRVVTGTLATIADEVRRMRAHSTGDHRGRRCHPLRDKLNGFERKPLFGKRVAVTRSAHQSRRFGEILADRAPSRLSADTSISSPSSPIPGCARHRQDILLRRQHLHERQRASISSRTQGSGRDARALTASPSSPWRTTAAHLACTA
jgi:uroporphyrinogen III methyltransferase/synthase